MFCNTSWNKYIRLETKGGVDMNQILKIAKHNFKMFFIRPLCIILLLSPILLSVASQQLFNSIGIGKMGLYTEDKSGLTYKIEQELTNQGLEIRYYEDQNSLKESIQKEEMDLGILVTASNAYETLKQGDIPYTAIKMDKNEVATGVLSLFGNKLGQMKLLIEGTQNEEVFNKRYEEMQNYKPIIAKLDTMKHKNTMTTTFSFFIMMFLLTVGVSLSPMMREREQDVYSRILAAPLKRYQYVLGHLMGGFIIVFGQLIIQLIVMRILDIDFNLDNLQFIAIGGTLCLVGLAISMLILSFSKNSTIYYLIMGTSVTPLCMFSDTFFPVELFPEWLEKLSYISPIRWIMMGYRGMINEIDIEVILRYLVVATLMAGVLILISLVTESKGSKIFKI